MTGCSSTSHLVARLLEDPHRSPARYLCLSGGLFFFFLFYEQCGSRAPMFCIVDILDITLEYCKASKRDACT